MAKDIADVLGAKTRRDGYYEGAGDQVTWTFGHLCTLKEPADYTDAWRSWNLNALPMIPPRFGIKLIDDKGVKRQFAVIESLMSRAEMIVNCGDAGQEGELIQRWVMQKAGVKCPVKRLWISSLTEDSIREGFSNLQQQERYNPLYEAGLCRAIGDWLLGMNATRIFTLKYAAKQSRQILSIGRVQTPTLALVVNRYNEIKNFVPEQYWELKTRYRDTLFTALKGRYTDKAEGEKALRRVDGAPFSVTKVEKRESKEYPPKLFDLTSLQVECNRRYAMSAEETLRTIQSLYEKKLTTYPRVDTTYLSEDIYPKCPTILKGLTSFTQAVAPLLERRLPKTKRIFDNSKVTDHHAIIPTGVPQRGVTEAEQRVYNLVALRFIAAFYPECRFSTTTVLGLVEKSQFKATGKEILEPGWRALYAKHTDNTEHQQEEENDDKILPTFTVGESGPHSPMLNERWTQPPKLYTEATLLRAMETAGKMVASEELRDALKENGIGRPSTRAAIIETLFKRGYMRKERKNLIPTDRGVELISLIDNELLKSAELTGLWEKRLREIERQSYSPAQFIEELKQMVVDLVSDVKRDKHIERLQ